jgi:hypothetical protein
MRAAQRLPRKREVERIGLWCEREREHEHEPEGCVPI